MTSSRQRGRIGRRRPAGRLAAVVVAATVIGGAGLVSAASAQTPAKAAKPTKVVKVATRSPYGQILTTVKKFALYVEPSGTCTGQCLVIWPPLLMPAGKTMPAGTPGLGTQSTSSGLQVTYNGLPLYRFYTDTKKTESGENVGGFVVAQVSTSARASRPATKTPKPTVVVKETTRGSFGEILITKSGKTLYTLASPNTCTAGCLTVWPPLLMPKGKTMPAGASGLGTTMEGGRLQVTYQSMALYTFSSDHHGSANGNGVGGFMVAQVSSSS